MPVNLSDLRTYEETERSKRGDHRPLIDLLRSDRPIPRAVRRYLADELERPPKQRFSRKIRKSKSVAERDVEIIRLVRIAKLEIAWSVIQGAESEGRTALEPNELGGLAGTDLFQIRWQHVSDNAALDRLAEQGHEVELDDLNNALGRLKRDNPSALQRLKKRPLLT